MNRYNARNQWNSLLESYRLIAEAEDAELKKLADEVEPQKVRTWEDLRGLFKVLLDKKDLEKAAAGGGAAGKLAKNIIGVIPGLNSIQALWGVAGSLKDVRSLVNTAYDLNDKKAEKSPMLDTLNVDDGYAEILDDRIEDEFLNWFMSTYLETATGPIDPKVDNVNTVLEEFVKQRGDGAETIIDAETSAKFTDLEIPAKVSIIDKLGAAVKGLFDGII
tara:strand:+ start:4096 stop:4752 length:657 start_codon:yes stop_codon:yes gene_type:complete